MKREAPEVKVGQVWIDNHNRYGYRELKVVRIQGRFAYCIASVYADVWSTTTDGPIERKTRIQLRRFRPTRRGYQLQEEDALP